MRANSDFMRMALRLARRGYGTTSPNLMVETMLVSGEIIGSGWTPSRRRTARRD